MMKNFILNYFWFLSGLKLRFRPKIIAISGSAGKTSTRLAIATILEQKYKIISASGNLNTEFGVPYVLLNLSIPNSNFDWIKNILKGLFTSFFAISPDYIVILELGADKPKDISFFIERLNIDIAVLTNIGNAHLQNFTSKQELAFEKLNLMRAVRENGTLIYNADDVLLSEYAISFPKNRKFSFGKDGDTKIKNIKFNLSGVKAQITTSTQDYLVQLPAINKMLFWSIAPSVVVGELLDVSKRKIEQGLKKYYIENGRGKILSGLKNSTIIDHSYNANPTSCVAVLESLGQLSTKRKKIAVLGEMKELGKISKQEHIRVGKVAKQYADLVFTLGEESKDYGCRNFNSTGELSDFLLKELSEGDIILFIGSQASRLEKVIINLLPNQNIASNLLVRQSQYWRNQ